MNGRQVLLLFLTCEKNSKMPESCYTIGSSHVRCIHVTHKTHDLLILIKSGLILFLCMHICTHTLAQHTHAVKSFIGLSEFSQPYLEFAIIIMSEKLCQDPLDSFFGKQWMRGGYNDNPTVQSFPTWYCLIVNPEVSSTRSKERELQEAAC